MSGSQSNRCPWCDHEGGAGPVGVDPHCPACGDDLTTPCPACLCPACWVAHFRGRQGDVRPDLIARAFPDA